MGRINKIGFGGGCHWCTEAVFQSLIGVERVEQGWVSAEAPHESYSEAVIVRFDPEVISLSVLIAVHLGTHSCTSNHSMRNKYRSAVYVYNDDEKAEVEGILDECQKQYELQLVTLALRLISFKENDSHYINYYASNPDKPFCRNIIDPKLKELMVRFARYVK